MARRKDQVLDGRWIAGEDGSLFVTTDGVAPVFDWEIDDVHPTPEIAAAAWERARVKTWRHPDRETVWPPVGAAWDGLVSRTEACGYTASPGQIREAADADLADVARFRTERPDAADAIAAELDEYTQALELIAGLAARPGDGASKLATYARITSRGRLERPLGEDPS